MKMETVLHVKMNMMSMIKENAKNNKTTVMIIVMWIRMEKSRIKTVQGVKRFVKNVHQVIT